MRKVSKCSKRIPLQFLYSFFKTTFEFNNVNSQIAYHSFNLAPDEDLLIRSKYRALLFNQDVRIITKLASYFCSNFFNKFFKILQKFFDEYIFAECLSKLKFWRRHCSTGLEWNSCMKFCLLFSPQPKSIWRRP